MEASGWPTGVADCQELLSPFRRMRSAAARGRLLSRIHHPGRGDRRTCRRRRPAGMRNYRPAGQESRIVGGSGELILGISGASGARLALRALRLFSGSPDVVHLTSS